MRNCFLTHKEILSFLADNFDEPGIYLIRRHGRTAIYAYSSTMYKTLNVLEFKPEVPQPEEETVQDA